MRTPSVVLVSASALLCGSIAALGCAETPYDFFSEDGVNSAIVDCDSPEGQETPACWEPIPGVGYFEDAGEIQDDLPGDACESRRNPGLEVVRLSMNDEELCIARGEETLISMNVSYFAALAPCAEDAGQMWTVNVGAAKAWEVRSESVNLNLDVRFLETEDGTPLVLYNAHDLPNQRFDALNFPDGSFSLVPLHATGQCITKMGEALEIWPCDEGPDQRFRLLACR
jgi:hypothetical protein